MYKDLFGKTRVKIGLHHHTTLSDGFSTPQNTVNLYRDAGYDGLALTDHWVFGNTQTIDGFPIFSGCEYNIGDWNTYKGVWHIVGLFMESEPSITPDFPPQKIIDAIHSVGGLAVLAHPAWSLNTPAMIKELHGFDATEIYNTVSGKGLSRRPDSSIIVDMLASDNLILPLIAADDSHYYGTNGWHDECTSFIMAECDSLDVNSIKEAVSSGKFYASTGPEIHLNLINGKAVVDSSPASEIVFMSNFSISPDRVFTGDGITHAEYTPYPEETFIRAYVTDKDGKTAWSNCIKLTK